MPPGVFRSGGWWMSALGTWARIISAKRFGALVMERNGPRGGAWFAVTTRERWVEWVAVYRTRVERREEGRRVREVERLLSTPPEWVEWEKEQREWAALGI